MLKLGIVIGTTRPNRKGEAVARWVHEIAAKRADATYELVDIKDYGLPLLDEPRPPSLGNYVHEHTRVWSAKIAELDGYVFITPEYNHSISGALKNAIDFVFHEWANKAAGFVSYGSTGGVRAVEHLRGILGEVQIADVRGHVSLSTRTDWIDRTIFKPGEHHLPELERMLGQVVAWSGAMKTLRQSAAASVA